MRPVGRCSPWLRRLGRSRLGGLGLFTEAEAGDPRHAVEERRRWAALLLRTAGYELFTGTDTFFQFAVIAAALGLTAMV